MHRFGHIISYRSVRQVINTKYDLGGQNEMVKLDLILVLQKFEIWFRIIFGFAKHEHQHDYP